MASIGKLAFCVIWLLAASLPAGTRPARPPEKAVVLFNGQDTSKWEQARLDNGFLREGAVSKDKFGDCRIHVEFNIQPREDGKRPSGNSGVYIQRRYEIQILNSHGKHQPGGGDCGAIYRRRAPSQNAAKPLGEWQVFDITFRQPQWQGENKTANARITVIHNGVKIHDDVEVDNKTGRGKQEGPQPGPIYLQNHGNKVLFRNIWVLPLAAAAAPPAETAAPKPVSPQRFAKQIQKFEKQDKASPPEAGTTVFVGSSSIRLWNLPKYFEGIKALNRGFGGSHISDVNFYARRIVLKYKPKQVVFFCGGNDLAHGKSPQRVLSDFQDFTKLLFGELPKTRLIVLAIKPSPRRVKFLDKVKKANELLRAFADTDDRIVFLPQAFDLLMDDNGKIREPLYLIDRVHLNEKGYRLWAKMLAPHIGAKLRD